MFKPRVFLLCIAVLIAVGGCSSQNSVIKASEKEKVVFFENEEAGLTIYESSNWVLDSVVSNEPFNATFKRDDVRAIVSIIPGERSLEQIKQELKLNRDFVKVLDESEDYLSFQMRENESIRSDIYREQAGEETLIVTFLTPLETYEQNSAKAEEFRKNIEIH
ncbi:hypothetical protein [Halalkalibacter urbisdiaboli]|uniref:hypothetical protein n=1 Tax=Halalkalibacter urbisdiaboli TaxID=1960589 RepID=UPI000B42FD08|nr:hypothetical protein [Halalkalibacter urbisdiaboli]